MSPAAQAQARRRRRARIAIGSVALVAVLAVGAVVGGFAWLRWFSADDHGDMLGTWYLAGTSTPITITEDRINLTDDVSYRYSIDPTDKTIAFTFTNLSGSGCYRFSLDRDELALFDGSFTGSDTLNRDIGWTLEALVKKLSGDRLAPAEPGEEGLTLLSRTPAKGASSASSASRSEDATSGGAAASGEDATSGGTATAGSGSLADAAKEAGDSGSGSDAPAAGSSSDGGSGDDDGGSQGSAPADGSR